MCSRSQRAAASFRASPIVRSATRMRRTCARVSFGAPRQLLRFALFGLDTGGVISCVGSDVCCRYARGPSLERRLWRDCAPERLTKCAHRVGPFGRSRCAGSTRARLRAPALSACRRQLVFERSRKCARCARSITSVVAGLECPARMRAGHRKVRAACRFYRRACLPRTGEIRGS